MRYFNLYSDILITKGANRVLISDLQRSVSELQPLEFFDIIEELKTKSVEEILAFYDDASKQIVLEYIDYLKEREYGFITEGNWDIKFPPLSFEFHSPGWANDIFIELEEVAILGKLRSSIEKLGIKHIVIYSTKALSFNDFCEIDRYFELSRVESIEIFAAFDKGIDETFFQELDLKTKRIYHLVFYNCEKAPFETAGDYRFGIKFSEQELQISSCGKVDLKYFNTDLSKILEAVNHNSCLHKKIGIDSKGNIKNCPAMVQSFGNIQETTLEEALNQPGFKKYWNLTKDKIETCKDCEFRNICTDCRAYTERTHTDEAGLDISKPLKCGYDPYTNRWEEWSINPLKQNAMQHYGVQELVKNSLA